MADAESQTGTRLWLGSYGRVLSQPVLRRVLPSMLVSALGDGTSMVAVAWLAVQIAPPKPGRGMDGAGSGGVRPASHHLIAAGCRLAQAVQNVDERLDAAARAGAGYAARMYLHIAVTTGSFWVHQGMRIGNVEFRPLGGGIGCLLMILVSLVLSVLCTIAANLLLR